MSARYTLQNGGSVVVWRLGEAFFSLSLFGARDFVSMYGRGHVDLSGVVVRNDRSMDGVVQRSASPRTTKLSLCRFYPCYCKGGYLRWGVKFAFFDVQHYA
jgi:hypothetical protein